MGGGGDGSLRIPVAPLRPKWRRRSRLTDLPHSYSRTPPPAEERTVSRAPARSTDPHARGGRERPLRAGLFVPHKAREGAASHRSFGAKRRRPPDCGYDVVSALALAVEAAEALHVPLRL